MSKNKFSRYNSGKVFVYLDNTKQTDFNAKRNVSTLDDMKFIAKLDFEESSKREQDFEFANQNGFSLTMKIRTRRLESIDNKCKAVINNYLYDIKYTDKIGVEMWLYLEGVKSLATK